ncbi:MAG TPA: DHHA1 domain-containing protein, partial [Isosphaeraceae bacterium]|nr:DHHA1 domain-containing protein [Isosphaeraceae bacterium]
SEEEELMQAATALKVPSGGLAERVAALAEEVRALKKQLAQKKVDSGPKSSPDDLLNAASVLGDVKVVAAAVPGAAPDELRQLIDVLRRKVGSGLAALLMTESAGKVILAAGLTPDLVERGLHAGNWLKEVAPVVGGGGGGRPDFAQAGGKNPAKIPDAVEKAVSVVQAKMGG